MSSPPDDRIPTILVIDDDPAVRQIERRYLEADGYQVLEAPSAQDGLRLIESGRVVDLLIADLAMPEMSGEEMVARLRPRHPQLKVLYVSGRIDRLMDERALRTTEAFLEKPFTRPQLAEAVSMMLFGTIARPT